MRSFVKLLMGLDNLLAKIEGFCVVSILITMLGFASLQVILRNFFDTGIEWGDVFARHLVLWVGFFGATLSTKVGQHIRIDALTKAFPPRFTPLAEMIVSAFSFTVALLLTMAAYRFLDGERMANENLFLNVKTWYLISIMPVGFGLITFRYFVQLMEQLFKFSGQKIETSSAAKDSNESPGLEVSVKIKLS